MKEDYPRQREWQFKGPGPGTNLDGQRTERWPVWVQLVAMEKTGAR